MATKNPRQAKKNVESAWNLEEIQELIDMLIAKQVSEFELEKAGVKIRIQRGNSGPNTWAPAATGDTALEVAQSAAEGRIPEEPHEAPAAAPEHRQAESAEGLHIIKSPIVGTFYAAPAPSAPPFVKPGDTVSVGQVLCIIEAMKLMNEIESEASGEIVRIYVENGQPVEYGQSLFAIKPSSKR